MIITQIQQQQYKNRNKTLAPPSKHLPHGNMRTEQNAYGFQDKLVSFDYCAGVSLLASAASVTEAISQCVIAHSENVKATEAQGHREACWRVLSQRVQWEGEEGEG